MKVLSKKIEKDPKFKPFELTLRFDTQQEAEVFHFLFNYRPLVDLGLRGYASFVRDAIENYCPDADRPFDDLKEAIRTNMKTA